MKKVYAAGTVNLSTEEYRDLVEGYVKAVMDYRQESSKRWAAEDGANRLQKEIAELRLKYQVAVDFINEVADRKDSFRLYKATIRAEIEDD